MGSKNDIANFEAEKSQTDLTNTVAKISEKEYDFLLGWMYFTGSDGYQIFLAFLPMFSSIILDKNKKVTNWTSTGISPEKIKPFDTNLEMIMPDLDNGRVTLKFSNSVLVQKNVSALHSNFILNLYIVCEVSTWPRCPTNNVRLTNCLFGTDKSKFPDNGRGMPFDGEGF